MQSVVRSKDIGSEDIDNIINNLVIIVTLYDKLLLKVYQRIRHNHQWIENKWKSEKK